MKGEQYGLWTDTGKRETKGKNKFFLVRCKCGLEKFVQASALRKGRSKGCRSCRAKECYVKPSYYPPGPRGFAVFNPKKTHGMSGTRVYGIWKGMLRRVRYNERGYGKYTICDRWQPANSGFVNFLEDMGQPTSNKHSLDRINNDAGYYPGNCRWATAKEQARNRRSTRRLDVDGRLMVMAEAAEIYKVSQSMLCSRLKSNWTTKQALGIDPAPKKKSRAGDKCAVKKLSSVDVKQIFTRIKSGESTRQKEADKYEVSYWTICSIMQGKTWKEVTEALSLE